MGKKHFLMFGAFVFSTLMTGVLVFNQGFVLNDINLANNANSYSLLADSTLDIVDGKASVWTNDGNEIVLATNGSQSDEVVTLGVGQYIYNETCLSGISSFKLDWDGGTLAYVASHHPIDLETADFTILNNGSTVSLDNNINYVAFKSSTDNLKVTSMYITYSCVYIAENYTVNFYDINKTSILNSVTILENEVIDALDVPNTIKDLYEFDGWYLDDDYTQKFDLSTKIQKSINLYGKWNPSGNAAYTVNHYLQNIDGTYPSTPEAVNNLDALVDSSVTPGTIGYVGFTSPSTQTIKVVADGSATVNYYYTRNSYTLTWNANGGSLSGSYTSGNVKYGQAITAPTASKTGYDFTSWNNDVPATMPAYDLTLTANYSLAVYSVTGTTNSIYSITNISKISANYNETITFKISLLDSSKEIIGAKVTDKSGNEVSVSENTGTYSFKMPASNVTITALYQDFTHTYQPVAAFDESKIVLRAPITSDEHCENVRTSGSVTIDAGKQTTQSLKNFRSVVGRDTFDIWLSAGDRSNSGTTEADKIWLDAYVAGAPDAASKLFFCHGNHDVYWTGCDTREEHYNWFKQNSQVYSLDQDLTAAAAGNRHAVVNGYHFIALDMQSYMPNYNVLSSATVTWFNNVMAEIAKEKEVKPVFVVVHSPAFNTVTGSLETQNTGLWGAASNSSSSTSQLGDLLGQYPNIIAFAGHTHYPLNDDRSIWQGNCTVIQTSTLAGGLEVDDYYDGINVPQINRGDYSANETNLTRSHSVDFNSRYKYSAAMYMEVDAYNNVRITRYDLQRSVQMKDEWIVPGPQANNSHLVEYSNEYRMANNQKPVLEGSINVDHYASTGAYKIAFDTFTDDDMIYAYHIQLFKNLTPTQITIHTPVTEGYLFFDDWYNYPAGKGFIAGCFSHTFTGNYARTDTVTIRVVAFDIWNSYNYYWPNQMMYNP